MFFDQLSLLTAIGFSTAALMVTLFIGWITARDDKYLMFWSVGSALVVAGVVSFGLLGNGYQPLLHGCSFVLIKAGLIFVYLGALAFRQSPITALHIVPAILLDIAIAVLFITGWSGIGTIAANLCMGSAMVMAGREYWQGRSEARALMTANSVLYGLVGLSFMLCALPLFAQEQWVLTERPDNWAESLNAVAIIAGVTGIGAISLALNQTRRARLHRRQAMTDPLTGLLNRRALFDQVSTAPLPGGTAVVMFDLDHFKAINDRLGHDGGDRVLQHFGAILRDTVDADDLAARLGGEEFCVVLRATPTCMPLAVAEQIRARFAQTGLQWSATTSAGIAIAAPGSEPFDALLRRADELLYAAKAAGRNCVQAPAPRLVTANPHLGQTGFSAA